MNNRTSQHRKARDLFAGRTLLLLCTLALAAAAVLLPNQAQAEDFTWIGDENAEWEFAYWNPGNGLYYSNWSPDGLPSVDDVLPGPNDLVWFVDAPNSTIELFENQTVNTVYLIEATTPFTFVPHVAESLTLRFLGTGGSPSHTFECTVIHEGTGNWEIDNPQVTLTRQLVVHDRLRKTGAGTLRLTYGGGSQSNTDRLVVDDGLLLVDGGRVSNSLLSMNGGDVTIQNGGEIFGLSDTSLRDGVFTVTGADSYFATVFLNMDAGPGDNGSLIVENDADATCLFLNIGLDADSHVDISAGGSMNVSDETRFLTSGSTLTVDGGTFTTDQLSSDPGITPTITINDPDGGAPAVTIGGDNGSSSFGGGIVDTFSEPGSIHKIGTGTFTLTGYAYNPWGGITIDGGTIAAGNGGTTGHIAADMVNNGTVAFNRSDDNQHWYHISGTGSLVKNGANTLTLASTSDTAHTYTGGTVINEGTLRLGDGSYYGRIVGDIENHGTLLINHNSAIEFNIDGILSGDGLLELTNQSRVHLTATNPCTGSILLNYGTALTIGDGGTSGSIVCDVINDGTLYFSRIDDVTYDGVISGSGNIRKASAGVLTLTGASTTTGSTNVYSSGTILVNNTTGSGTGSGDVWVGGALGTGTLGGTGTIDGVITVSNGGILAPGDGVGVLTCNLNVLFEEDSTFAVELAGNGGIAGTDFDQLDLSGSGVVIIDENSTLDLSYINPFTAAPGDSFVILESSLLVSGEFTTIIWPDGQNWVIEYDAGGGTITVRIAPTGCEDPGDMNEDGFENGLDIQQFVGCVIDGGDCQCADMNCDEPVDDIDIPLFVDCILNGNCDHCP